MLLLAPAALLVKPPLQSAAHAPSPPRFCRSRTYKMEGTRETRNIHSVLKCGRIASRAAAFTAPPTGCVTGRPTRGRSRLGPKGPVAAAGRINSLRCFGAAASFRKTAAGDLSARRDPDRKEAVSSTPLHIRTADQYTAPGNGGDNYAPNAGFMKDYPLWVEGWREGATLFQSAHSGESRNPA